MSFEALNNLALSHSNVLVIVNDNHIGIDPNNGAMDKHLQEIEHSKSNFFQNLGLDYTGPVDGHDITSLVDVLEKLRHRKTPQVLHIRTTKGKGYGPAESEQTRWHSTSKYVKIDTQKPAGSKKWQDVFADSLDRLAVKYSNIVGVTPAMPSGSGMIKLMEKFPDRFFDVGIAEQHAVTFSAGLATEGFVTYLNIYSTFLQRGYDQLIHDVALQKLPVVFCIDRAGLVGEDGPTHHGAFDISFLRPIPEITISAPRNEVEFHRLMELAYAAGKPFAIRYPKGEITNSDILELSPQFPAPQELRRGEKTAILSTGIASNFALEACAISKTNPSVVHFPLIKPLDVDTIANAFRNHKRIITVEDGSITGGFGESIAALAVNFGFNGTITSLGIPDEFVTHGENKILYDLCGYSAEKIAALLLLNLQD
jgi:1-deoxy-D-xylulose-5-phosphate synthase